MKNAIHSCRKSFFSFLFLCFSLSCSSFCKGQGVIQPPNFLNYTASADDERTFHVYEMKDGGGYLFSVALLPPSTNVDIVTRDYFYFSARLIKTDQAGNELAVFNVPWMGGDTVFTALSACETPNEILFFVSLDSTVYNKKSTINLGLLVYHLDKTNLTLVSVDSFIHLLPTNHGLSNLFQIAEPDGTIYSVIRHQHVDSLFFFQNLLLKTKLNPLNGKINVTTLPIDRNIIPNYDVHEALNLATSITVNNNKDSVDVMFSFKDSLLGYQAFCMLSVDTSFAGFTSHEFELGSYHLNGGTGSFLAPDFQSQGIKTQFNKYVLGYKITLNDYQYAGMIKLNKADSSLEAYLYIPDSNFGLKYKYVALNRGLQMRNGKLFCMAFDVILDYGFTFNDNENHIYVGKADTAMQAWEWYKYISLPNKFLAAYDMIATADGGCMIAAGVYDYLNNPASNNFQHDIYIIRLDANGVITSIFNPAPEAKDYFAIYPVPAQQEVFLDYKGSDAFDFYVYDVSGKEVMRNLQMTAATKKLSLQNLQSGNYFYKAVFKSKKINTGKLIKL